MKINFKKILHVFLAFFAFVFFFVSLFYFLILPQIFKSEILLNSINNVISKNYGLNLALEEIEIKTSLKPEIRISFNNLKLCDKTENIIFIKDFNFKFNFKDILKKTISLETLTVQKLDIKTDKLLSILPQNNSSKVSKNDFKVDFKNSTINLKEINLSYLQNSTKVDLKIEDIKLDESLDFKLFANVFKNSQKQISAQISADNNIFILDDKINVDDLKISLNNSNLNFNTKIEKNEIFLNVISNKFYLADVFEIIKTDLIIPNGETMLLPLNSPKGNVAFSVSLKNDELSGFIDVNNTSIKIKDVSNLPINIIDGKIKISKEKIDFQNLIGYYGKNKANKIAINGDIKDYYKTFDSNIEIESLITNEFFNDYLAPLINNTALYVSRPSRTKVIYKSKNNIMDLIWFAQIDKGVDFGVTSEKSALSDYDRAVLGEFNINGNKLDIKNINYYIASNIVRGVKLQPIIQINALMDLSGKFDRLGLAFGREMPCEFLNIFAGQKLFKKGTIKGNVNLVFKNDIPYLDADMEIDKTLIPSIRAGFRHLTLKTDKNLISIDALGRFKKANFEFRGDIKNELKAPYIVKNMSLNLDNVDVEKILASFNSQNTQTQVVQVETQDDFADDDYMFDTNLIRIEDCNFNLAKGNYKELTFGNIKANLTLDEKGVLKVKSNRFDIAQGTSSLKVECDLNKLKYYIKLGVKGIDSNLMAKTLFNLDREITGAANGIIELYGDETLKMNGDIKFLIDNGTIGKVGLVEYLLKIASVFRNPIVMVSPATIMDIISIPEGKFDKIVGNIKIKDNVLAPIDIKSYSNSLSALIKGKFDLERHDASLRIYTRFSSDKKSMFNILRNLSLNTLANKVKLNSKNDANYYESELKDLPQIDVDEDKTQIFLTQVEGDIEHFNFLSSLKKIK